MSQPRYETAAKATTLDVPQTDPAQGADNAWPEEANVLPTQDLHENPDKK